MLTSKYQRDQAKTSIAGTENDDRASSCVPTHANSVAPGRESPAKTRASTICRSTKLPVALKVIVSADTSVRCVPERHTAQLANQAIRISPLARLAKNQISDADPYQSGRRRNCVQSLILKTDNSGETT